ncbi:hypothetical protein [Chryseobacterium wanjuense]
MPLLQGIFILSVPYQVYDSNVPYVKNIFGFYGVSDISVFRAEGLSIPGIMETSLKKRLKELVLINFNDC